MSDTLRLSRNAGSVFIEEVVVWVGFMLQLSLLTILLLVSTGALSVCEKCHALLLHLVIPTIICLIFLCVAFEEVLCICYNAVYVPPFPW